MIIQHNIPAINAHRQLIGNNAMNTKSIQKLSSGYRINTAADDAAGLAISEKMRGQIRGLEQASRNAQDGISLIQTAEGALQESHAILVRMRELAVQSSNGTLQNDDRGQISLEVDALKKELDRISTSTEFNGIKLLDGSLDPIYGVKPGPARAAINGEPAVDPYVAGSYQNTIAGIRGITVTGGAAYLGTANASVNVQVSAATYDANGAVSKWQIAVEINGEVQLATVTAGIGGNTKDTDLVFNSGLKVTIDYTDALITTTAGVPVGQGTPVAQATGVAGVAVKTGLIAIAKVNPGLPIQGTPLMTGIQGSSLIFQIGANGHSDEQTRLSISDMSHAALGLKYISVATRQDANNAISSIDAATKQVSAQRASLGALQNRLEHTISNLGVTTENLSAAESRIRDVDMAKEMMNYTRTTILSQAAQSMLAQANQKPNQVLQLLQ